MRHKLSFSVLLFCTTALALADGPEAPATTSWSRQFLRQTDGGAAGLFLTNFPTTSIQTNGGQTGNVLTWLATGPTWGAAGGSGSQTPWQQNINGGTYSLYNIGTIYGTNGGFVGNGGALTNLNGSTLPITAGSNITITTNGASIAIAANATGLPANSIGSLTNDGSGNIGWSQGAVRYSLDPTKCLVATFGDSKAKYLQTNFVNFPWFNQVPVITNYAVPGSSSSDALAAIVTDLPWLTTMQGGGTNIVIVFWTATNDEGTGAPTGVYQAYSNFCNVCITNKFYLIGLTTEPSIAFDSANQYVILPWVQNYLRSSGAWRVFDAGAIWNNDYDTNFFVDGTHQTASRQTNLVNGIIGQIQLQKAQIWPQQWAFTAGTNTVVTVPGATNTAPQIAGVFNSSGAILHSYNAFPTTSLNVKPLNFGVAEPTWHGNIQIGSGATDAAENGIEWSASYAGSGYGWRLPTLPNASAGQDLVIESRQNSATWSLLGAWSGADGTFSISNGLWVGHSGGLKIDGNGSIITCPAISAQGASSVTVNGEASFRVIDSVTHGADLSLYAELAYAQFGTLTPYPLQIIQNNKIRMLVSSNWVEVATNLLCDNIITATNGYYLPQMSAAPTAASIGGSVGSVTNHLLKNVNGALIDYYSDGTTLWSKQLAP